MPGSSAAIQFVFLDIGGTLGNLDASGALVLLPGTRGLLEAFHDTLSLPIGIITNLRGAFTNDQVLTLLEQAGISGFIQPQAIFSEQDNHGVGKPDPSIYKLAAQKVGVPVGSCLFVGEDPIEVKGARKAGMQAIRKP